MAMPPAHARRGHDCDADPAPRRRRVAARERFELVLSETTLEKQAEVAGEFDTIHTVERALEVGSLSEIVDPTEMRAYLVRELRDD